MNRSFTIFAIIFLSLSINGYSQDFSKNISLPSEQETIPSFGVKTNFIYDLTATLNVGAELRILDYLTIDVSLNYNPWTFSNNRKFKHILLQPELRYWIDEPFNGHFLGGHLLYSHYNTGNLPFGSLKDHRYQGDAYGIGFSYGYQWVLLPRWNIEATFGIGYIHLDYTRYKCETCGAKLGNGNNNYFGPTKAGISLIYIIK